MPITHSQWPNRRSPVFSLRIPVMADPIGRSAPADPIFRWGKSHAMPGGWSMRQDLFAA